MQNKPLLTTAIAILFIAMSSRAQIKSTTPAEVQTKESSNSETKTLGSFKDSRDGKTYKIIKIGTQIWMGENLAYKAAEGCTAYNNDENNAKIYGYLYTWKVALSACPTGWHLPSDDEWTILTSYLGGEDVAGNKLRPITGWMNIELGASNTNGFRALPGGSSNGGSFYNVGVYGLWWSATESGGNAWGRSLYSSESRVYRTADYKAYGFSVRCIIAKTKNATLENQKYELKIKSRLNII